MMNKKILKVNINLIMNNLQNKDISKNNNNIKICLTQILVRFINIFKKIFLILFLKKIKPLMILIIMFLSF